MERQGEDDTELGAGVERERKENRQGTKASQDSDRGTLKGHKRTQPKDGPALTGLETVSRGTWETPTHKAARGQEPGPGQRALTVPAAHKGSAPPRLPIPPRAPVAGPSPEPRCSPGPRPAAAARPAPPARSRGARLRSPLNPWWPGLHAAPLPAPLTVIPEGGGARLSTHPPPSSGN